MGKRLVEAGDVPVADDRRLRDLYEREAARLVGSLHVYCRDRSLAEEAVQEAFARLVTRLDGIDDPAKASSYLRSIAFNYVRSHHRHLRVVHRRTVDAPSSPRTPEETYVLNEGQAEIVAAIASLSERQRACIVLRYYDDLTEREIAEVLHLSPNSVKTHIRRGMRMLTQSLEASA